jgi:hypothetical protein
MTATVMTRRVHALDSIICGEFNEMPGMRLTLGQVARLWALSAPDAHVVVRSLVARGLLMLDTHGRVCRPSDVSAC